jgi:GntR family transcriptional regulator
MLIDAKSPVPVFQQIATQLRQRIAAGVYGVNEALPSLRSLAADIRVNPNTVQRAYEALIREGLVESRRGAGVFVVDRADAARTNDAEQSVLRRLAQVIAGGLRKGITPDRLRSLFREALDSQVATSQVATSQVATSQGATSQGATSQGATSQGAAASRSTP